MEMDRNLYKFGFDWLNGVLPIVDVWEFFKTLEQFSSKLRFERWERQNSGKYNYSNRYCLDGQASFQIMWNSVSDEEAFTACFGNKLTDVKSPALLEALKGLSEGDIPHHNNGFVFISISGDGIRKLHAMGGDVSALNKLMFYLYRNGFNASRFDVYCDILDKNNTAVPIIQKAFKYFKFPQVGKPTLRTNVQRKDGNISMYRGVDDKGKVYYNCVLGNHGTRFGMFRCYNKRMELNEGRLAGEKGNAILNAYGNPDYWWRLEYEVHKENAAACFNACMAQAEENNQVLSFENIFASALERVFGIVTPTTMGRGLESYSYSDNWASFVDFVMADGIHLVEFEPVKYIPMSRSRLQSYLKKNSVFVYSMLVALICNKQLLDDVIDDGRSKYTKKPKYNEIRDELDYSSDVGHLVHSSLFKAADKLAFERGA